MNLGNDAVFHVIVVLFLMALLGVVVLHGWKARQAARDMSSSLNKIASETRFNGGGSIKDMVKVLFDAQQRDQALAQKASFRLEVMADSVDVALYETDAAAQVVWCNHSYLKFWDLSSLDEAKSEKWIEKLTPAGRELALTRMNAILLTQAAFRYTNHLKTGEMIEFIGEPINVNGEFLGWTGAVRYVDETLDE